MELWSTSCREYFKHLQPGKVWLLLRGLLDGRKMGWAWKKMADKIERRKIC